MAAFNKVNSFVQDLAHKSFDFSADSFKVALTNTAPTSASTIWNTTNFPAPAAANGYTAGGNTLSLSSSSQTAGLYKAIFADSVFTASGGQIGPFRYAVVYHVTSGKIVGYYDYGSSITLNDTETFTVDLDNTNGLLTLQ